MDSFPGLLMDSLPLAIFKWKIQSKSNTSYFREIHTEGLQALVLPKLWRPYEQEPGPSPEVPSETTEAQPKLGPEHTLSYKEGGLTHGFGCTLSCLCRHTWRSLENKGFFSEKRGEGYNQQAWRLRGCADHWRCKWLLQVGAAGWMPDAPGLETEKEALSNNSLASLSKQNPAPGAYHGPWEFQPSCVLSISLLTLLDVPFRTSVGYTIFRQPVPKKPGIYLTITKQLLPTNARAHQLLTCAWKYYVC